MRFLKFLIILFSSSLFSACVSAGDGVDIFFMGDDAIQYFFPSREWVSSTDGLSLEVDWLYRTFSLDEEEGGARTILNFSLYSTVNLYRSIPTEIRLSVDQVEIIVPEEHVSLVYLDRGKTRYSSWLYSSDVKEIMAMASESMIITLVMDKNILFESTSEFIPQIEYFKEVLLGIPPE